VAAKATKFGEIMPKKRYYAVQGHLKSLIFYTSRKLKCNFLLLINTDLILSCTVSKLSQIIGQILAFEGVRLSNTLVGVNP